MKKSFIYLFILIVALTSCENQKNSNSNKKNERVDSSNYFELKGTWIRFDKKGFSSIEIIDSLNVTYTVFEDNKALIDTITSKRYWYYKSSAKIGYFDSLNIWIETDKFRFDFKINEDTLIEYDKMGIQNKYLKMKE